MFKINIKESLYFIINLLQRTLTVAGSRRANIMLARNISLKNIFQQVEIILRWRGQSGLTNRIFVQPDTVRL